MAALEHWRYGDPVEVLAREQEANSDGARQVIDPFGTVIQIRTPRNRRMRQMDFRSRVPTALHERLEGWGELMRDRRIPESSPTAKICRTLAIMGGQPDPVDVVRRQPTGASIADAERIEAAWRGQLLTMREKTLLAGYYCYSVRPAKLCRGLAMTYREFDPSMLRAVMAIGALIGDANARLDFHARARENAATI